MNNHTPEPWQLDDNQGMCTNFYSDDATGSIIGSCQEYKFAHRSIDERKANALRIVTCVNACAGMEDPATEIDELKRQRDELLAALRSAVETIEWMHGCSSPASDEVEDAIREGNATIAKAKGGAA